MNKVRYASVNSAYHYDYATRRAWARKQEAMKFWKGLLSGIVIVIVLLGIKAMFSVKSDNTCTYQDIQLQCQ